MFGIVYYQNGKRTYAKVNKEGLFLLTVLHEEGRLVITTINIFSLGGIILSYNDFWDYYEDYCG